MGVVALMGVLLMSVLAAARAGASVALVTLMTRLVAIAVLHPPSSQVFVALFLPVYLQVPRPGPPPLRDVAAPPGGRVRRCAGAVRPPRPLRLPPCAASAASACAWSFFRPS